MRTFGKRVRDLRLAAGITSQEALALRIETDRTYVGGIERGERNPTFEIIERLAKVFRMSMSELLDFDSNPRYSPTSRKVWLLNDK